MAKKKTTKKKAVKKKDEGPSIEKCPFALCKGKAVLTINPWGKYVSCTACDANGPQYSTEDADKVVIDSWNKR